MICCTSKTVINFSTSGLLAVRQDELMILLELNDDMMRLPKEVFMHLNEIYNRADKNNTVIKEYGYSQASSNTFLGAFGGELNDSGFVFQFCNYFKSRILVHQANLPMPTIVDPSRRLLPHRTFGPQMGNREFCAKFKTFIYFNLSPSSHGCGFFPSV